jgi:hypothetical protein
MGLKIVAKLPDTHDDRVANLLHLRIVFLGSYQDLRHEIHEDLLVHIFAIFHVFFLDDYGSADC